MRQDLYGEMYEQEERYWWHRAKRELVKQFLPQGKNLRILDIGCGTGQLMRELKSHGEVWGIDQNKEAVSFCRRRKLKNVFLAKFPKQVKIQGQFDVITCVEVLEHIKDHKRACVTIERLLKRDGRVIFTVPANPWLFSYWDEICGHYRRYDKRSLTRVIEKAGLKIVKCSYVYTFLLPIVFPFRIVRGRMFATKSPQSDFVNLPSWLSGVLVLLARVERFVMRIVNIPFGLSLVCVAEKK